MSDSVESPSSTPFSANNSKPSTDGSPPSNSVSPSLVSASPPSNLPQPSATTITVESPPPPNLPPPSSPPALSPPPSGSSPPHSLQPPPPSSPQIVTPHSPPPLPKSPSSSTPPPSKNEPQTVPSQSSPPPPTNLAAAPQSPLHFVPPPAAVGGVQSPPPSIANARPISSNSNTPLTTAAPAPKQSASNGDPTSAATALRTGNKSSSNSSEKAVLGTALVVLLAVVAIFFVLKKRKRRNDYYAPQYLPPKNLILETDRYHYGQVPPHSAGFSQQMNFSYGSQIPMESPDSFGTNQTYNGESDVISSSKTHFSYEEAMEMTDGFSRRNIIGEGGFGCVFKGRTSDGKSVAVKQLKAGSGQGDREFKAEVEIISRVHHRHLVSLVGYCISDSQRLLLYEFLPNKTLEHHLHESQVLDWPKRLRIAIGSAKGLAYLHEDCNPKIIHRDIKSANILLDDNFEAQVADFGLARLNDTTQTHVSTRVMGTFGYLAPEYASSGKLTDRSDVYSFGVVLLELITGRKPVDAAQPLGDESLVEWARPRLLRAIETGDLNCIVDPRLENNYVESKMFRMIETAAACVRHSAPKRPRMVQVVRALDTDEQMSDLSNGVKYGESTAYDFGQYNQDIMKFKRMIFSGTSSDFDTTSGEYPSREVVSSDFTSGELETQAMKDDNEKRYGGTRANLGSHRNG